MTVHHYFGGFFDSLQVILTRCKWLWREKSVFLLFWVIFTLNHCFGGIFDSLLKGFGLGERGTWPKSILFFGNRKIKKRYFERFYRKTLKKAFWEILQKKFRLPTKIHVLTTFRQSTHNYWLKFDILTDLTRKIQFLTKIWHFWQALSQKLAL